MKKVLNFAVIGLGCRGYSMIKSVLLPMEDVNIIAVCDIYLDRVENAQKLIEEKIGNIPFGTCNYAELLNRKDLDAVFIATAWESHLPIATAFALAKIPVALEVGGAYNLESLQVLVNTIETTKTPFMLMENCCFGKAELLATSLVRNKILGDVVYCHGAYAHHLCDEIAGGEKNRHYRLRNYLSRNCENYPTHDLGPIAKILNINRGNAFVSLVSVASRSAGMKEYVNAHKEEYPNLVGKTFAQGDIIDTIITCADGSTISLRLDTTLPRSYSREFTVRGTKGLYEAPRNYVFLEGDKEGWEEIEYVKETTNNAVKFEKDYLPKEWANVTEEQLKAGHGGMDYLEFRAFITALKENREMPIDVYDCASWMAVSVLSENSIKQNGAPQYFPDFTNGKWKTREPKDVVELPKIEK